LNNDFARPAPNTQIKTYFGKQCTELLQILIANNIADICWYIPDDGVQL